MGLDVGVVKITYLDRPDEPVYDFLWALAAGDLDEGWGGGWDGNAFVQFERDRLLEEASGWADRQGLGGVGQGALRQWVEDLPWDGNTIMLHLDW